MNERLSPQQRQQHNFPHCGGGQVVLLGTAQVSDAEGGEPHAAIAGALPSRN